jgi:hypothetical protein
MSLVTPLSDGFLKAMMLYNLPGNESRLLTDVGHFQGTDHFVIRGVIYV